MLETEKKRNILFVAITRMGDMLQASPMMLGIKRENPEARITVFIEKNFAGICKGLPAIDEVIEVDLGFAVRCLDREGEGIVDAYRYLDEVVQDLKSRNFDFCVNMASSAFTAILLKMLDIEDNRGWISDEEGFRIIENPWAMLFAAFVYHSNRDFNSINLVDIFRCSAGVKAHPHHLVYNVPEDAESFVDNFLKEEGLQGDGPLICIQAGASQEKRQWAPIRFVKLVEILQEQLNARIVFTGAKSEVPIIDLVLKHCPRERVISAAGRTNLEQLGALLKHSDLLITGDTGPMHMAVGVGTPVVALFLASALCFETGPYGPGNIVIQPQIECNPCNPNFPCSRPDCHEQVSPELVAELSKLRLRESVEVLKQEGLPDSMANPDSVAVYITDFDNDGFLDFIRINKAASRKGRAAEYFEAGRQAYRQLWKEDFGAITSGTTVSGANIQNGIFNRERHSVNQEAALEGLGQAVELCQHGIELLERLCALVGDPSSSGHLLSEVNDSIEKVDRNIEEIGLANPLLGALIRMFVMEKENLRGDDVLLLASKTKELYQSLTRRSHRFAELYGNACGAS